MLLYTSDHRKLDNSSVLETFTPEIYDLSCETKFNFICRRQLRKTNRHHTQNHIGQLMHQLLGFAWKAVLQKGIAGEGVMLKFMQNLL